MFISRIRKNLLKLFFQHPTREFHLREISRRAEIVPQNVNKYATEFVRNGLLLRRNVGNMTLYRINPENNLLFKAFEIFEIERKAEFMSQNKKISRLLREYTENLIRLSNRDIQMILLFGSVARGSWSKGSDIDIMAVSSQKSDKKQIIQIHDEAKQKLDHIMEISAINVTINKFLEGIRSGLEFYSELWNDRIVLYNEFLFWQLIAETGLSNETAPKSDTLSLFRA